MKGEIEMRLQIKLVIVYDGNMHDCIMEFKVPRALFNSKE